MSRVIESLEGSYWHFHLAVATIRDSIYLRPEKHEIVAESTSSDWIISLKSKIGALDDERSLKMSIFKVPNKLRKVDEEAYSPRLVSIGPFHSSRTNKHDHLLAMDEQKRWYMLYLLNRTLNPKETLVQFVEAISELKPKVQRRYAENIKFKPQVLSEIMLDDGCFILELFLRSKLKDFWEEDPIFHNAWMVPTLRHDLVLLENQIPFFILEKLFNIVVRQFPEHLSCSITDLALSFFYPDLNLNQEAIRMKCSQVGICSHLLDLLHSFYIPTFPETDPKAKETRKFNKCATELVAAGIEFVKGKEDHFLDISFNKATGVITIPSFHIDERTKSLIRNFIALEQSIGSGTQQHITSYAILLESLIRSSSDIALLWKENIITNDLSEFEDVLTFFKSISREVVPMDFNFGELCEDVNAYQKSWCHWHRLVAFLKVRCQSYIAVLKNNYFSTPWTFISFIAAVVLLVLTIVQTYYAVLSYQHSH